jgi:hypothetical protein
VGPTAGALAEFGSPLTVTDGTTSVPNVTTIVSPGAAAGGAGEVVLRGIVALEVAPTAPDLLLYPIGTIWINVLTGQMWRKETGEVGDYWDGGLDLDGSGPWPAGIYMTNGAAISVGNTGTLITETDIKVNNVSVAVTTDARFPTADEKAALDAAPTALTALNPVASIADLPGPAPSPAMTVTGPDSFGASAVVGTGTTYARADHNHGLPAAPYVPLVWEDLF